MMILRPPCCDNWSFGWSSSFSWMPGDKIIDLILKSEIWESHLWQPKEADKDPKQSSPATHRSTKASQECLCVSAELGVDNFNGLVKYDGQCWDGGKRTKAGFVIESCDILVCLTRNFALELIIMSIDRIQKFSCLNTFPWRIELSIEHGLCILKQRRR